jgi:hypothetical protein
MLNCMHTLGSNVRAQPGVRPPDTNSLRVRVNHAVYVYVDLKGMHACAYMYHHVRVHMHTLVCMYGEI